MEDPLTRLQHLQQDLIAFTQKALPNLARLSSELDACIGDFRKLLDRKGKSEESRKVIEGKWKPPSALPQNIEVIIDGTRCGINKQFQEAVYNVADQLQLDEVETAKICLATQGEMDVLDGTLPLRTVLRFHRQREALLDCFRLVLRESISDGGEEDGNTAAFQNLVQNVVMGPGQTPNERSKFWRKCLDATSSVEGDFKKTQDHLQMIIITGQSLLSDDGQALQAQTYLLTRQHESLSSILSYLIKGGHAQPEDFRSFLSKAASTEAPADFMAHYAPILICGSTYFGSESAVTDEQARDLHKLFATGPGQLKWKHEKLQAATTIWWLSEFSSRYSDVALGPSRHEEANKKAIEEQTKLFFEAIKRRGLHHMLALCDFLKPEIWHEPAKVGMIRWLLDHEAPFPQEAVAPSQDFSKLTMQELQNFAGAFVDNLYDAFRQLKHDEDNQRRNNLFVQGTNGGRQADFDVERFLAILSYAYQDEPEAAQDFWSDREGNLYGFLRYISTRLPTPRVAAFCELLKSIANDESSANHAHRFLLEDTTLTSGKVNRKTHAVSWAQIFSEFEIYASTIRRQPAIQHATGEGQNGPPEMDIVEPETFLMLEAYMRLTSHICRHSPDARNWILREQPFRLHEICLQLASSNLGAQIPGCCFDLLAALLTDKVPEVNDGMWILIDGWISGGNQAGANGVRIPAVAGPRRLSEKHYLQHIAAQPENATAFVGLLVSLIEPMPSQTEATLDALPFPEQLGSQNRHAGIDAYVDFVLGTVFASTRTTASSIEDRQQLSVLRHTCLTFAWLCLSTFNDNLVVLANTTGVSVEPVMKTTSLANYVRLHPFARTMDHLFNSDVISALFQAAQQNSDELDTFEPASPLVQATVKAVQVMNFAMKLQPTYFDIVRPVIKTQAPNRALPVGNAALASFDEVMLSELGMSGLLARFSAGAHVDLALESLSLLKKLSASRKLTGTLETGPATQRVGNRLLGTLHHDVDAITGNLKAVFSFNVCDLETGKEPLNLVKAHALLELLNSSMKTSPTRPNIAHCLLGFRCSDRMVDVEPNGLFDNEKSLFHAVVDYAIYFPQNWGSSNVSWLLQVKHGCLEVLLSLAAAPLTTEIVRLALRNLEWLPAMWLNQTSLRADGTWNGLPSDRPDTLLAASSQAICYFMRTRELLFEYSGLELRALVEARTSFAQEKVVDALLGTVAAETGVQPTVTVFELFDFFDIDIADPTTPEVKLLRGMDFAPCVQDNPDTGGLAFDLTMAKELLTLRKRELWISGKMKDPGDEQQVNEEIVTLLASLTMMNNHRAIQRAKLSTLEAWVDLLSCLLTVGIMEEESKMTVALQCLQVILPRFERSLADNLDAAAQLAKLVLTLVQVASSVSAASGPQGQDLVQERSCSALRIGLKAIADGETNLALRDICYRTCCSVLAAASTSNTGTRSHSIGTFSVNGGINCGTHGRASPSPIAKQLLQILQGAGERVLTVATGDAFSGRGVTRVSALLFLDALLRIFQTARASMPMLRALTKLNFIPVLIDTSIGSVASSMRGDDQELPVTLSYFHTALALLLRICQAPDGTQLVLNSGFFASVTDSQLFSTDPDIGLDIDNPFALRQFYRLLSSVLKVITAVVVAKGPSNASTLQQARLFLTQNRSSMKGVFKRTSAVKNMAVPPEMEAREVAEEFGRLLLVTGFLEEDESAYQRSTAMNGFT